jgi:hypothetical protein
MIVNALLSAVAELKKKFEKAQKADKASFTFDSAEDEESN